MNELSKRNTISAFSSNNYILISKGPFLIDSVSLKKTATPPRSHYHDAYELCYIVSGELRFFIKDKSYLAKKGTLVLINAYDIHSVSKGEYKRVVINFKKEYIQDILESTGSIDLLECFRENINMLKIDIHDLHYIENLFNGLLDEETSKNPGHELYTKTLLVQVLLFINRYKKQILTSEFNYAKSYHKTISDISTYICDNFKEDINLKTISEQFFISPSYFSRTFKKVTGLTFIEYLNSIRIKEAQKLIKKTSLSIAEISEIVGYKSNTHFGRIFKSIVGTSPNSYRQRFKKSSIKN